jgi:hypothetical protein
MDVPQRLPHVKYAPQQNFGLPLSCKTERAGEHQSYDTPCTKGINTRGGSNHKKQTSGLACQAKSSTQDHH